MRTGLILAAVLAALVFCSVERASADAIVNSSGALGGLNTTPNQTQDSGTSSASASFSASSALHSGSSSISMSDGAVHAYVDAYGSSTSSLATMLADGTWSDQFSLDDSGVDTATRAAYAGMDLIFNYALEGRVSLDVRTNDIFGYTVADYLIELQAGNPAPERDRVSGRMTGFGGGAVDIDELLSVTLTQSPTGAYAYALHISLRVTALDADAIIDFGNTASPFSITFANGVRPEDIGYQLNFDSGMSSPNISAVPEPGSIALLGLGLVGLGFASRRRKARVS